MALFRANSHEREFFKNLVGYGSECLCVRKGNRVASLGLERAPNYQRIHTNAGWGASFVCAWFLPCNYPSRVCSSDRSWGKSIFDISVVPRTQFQCGLLHTHTHTHTHTSKSTVDGAFLLQIHLQRTVWCSRWCVVCVKRMNKKIGTQFFAKRNRYVAISPLRRLPLLFLHADWLNKPFPIILSDRREIDVCVCVCVCNQPNGTTRSLLTN